MSVINLDGPLMTGAELRELIRRKYPVYGYWHPTGDGIDGSGLGRAAKRQAVIEMQGGRCATCPSARSLCGDHDHVSGLMRGVLCRPCNSSRPDVASHFRRSRVLAAYEANPPFTRLGWLWDLPLDTGPFAWISAARPRARLVVSRLDAGDARELARALAAMGLPLPAGLPM